MTITKTRKSSNKYRLGEVSGLIPIENAAIVWNEDENARITDMHVYFIPNYDAYDDRDYAKSILHKIRMRHNNLSMSTGIPISGDDIPKELGGTIVEMLSILMYGSKDRDTLEKCLHELGKIKENESIRKVYKWHFDNYITYDEFMEKHYSQDYCTGY